MIITSRIGKMKVHAEKHGGENTFLKMNRAITRFTQTTPFKK